MIPLELNSSRPRTIDNRRAKLLTDLAGRKARLGQARRCLRWPTVWSTNEQRKRQRNDTVTIYYIYYLFYVLYSYQSCTTCIWSWNYRPLRIFISIIYYCRTSSILCLRILIPGDLILEL